jgi:hypothetical protein
LVACRNPNRESKTIMPLRNLLSTVATASALAQAFNGHAVSFLAAPETQRERVIRSYSKGRFTWLECYTEDFGLAAEGG